MENSRTHLLNQLGVYPFILLLVTGGHQNSFFQQKDANIYSKNKRIERKNVNNRKRRIRLIKISALGEYNDGLKG